MISRLFRFVRTMNRETWSKVSLWIIVTSLTTGIPATAEAAWQKFTSDTLALGFSELLALTAPLIWSIAAVSFAWQRNWIRDGGVIPAAAIIVAGGWLGHWIGHGSAVSPLNLLPTDDYALLGTLVFRAVNQLAGYVASYGLAASTSSVLVGITLGVVWSSWIDKISAFNVTTSGVIPRRPSGKSNTQKKRRTAA